ncbi:hypothetical protein TIFTF001_016062 [Ficus carica]|uniref:Uncharacterized protein n=1 Tax=Ficus carica TaxID=3494 RepID=A0AA88A9Y6_FICCA|nr:hypothetical protein TIFTF001_016062 [Ficus carica]
MDDMINRWKSLAITEEEEDVVGLDDEDIAQGKAEMCHGLLGRLLTRKLFNILEDVSGDDHFPIGCERFTNVTRIQLHSLPPDNLNPRTAERIANVIERDENTVSAASGDGSSRRNWRWLARQAKGSGLAAFELSNLKRKSCSKEYNGGNGKKTCLARRDVTNSREPQPRREL